MFMDFFYDFVEEHLEVAPPEEQMACNSMILCDVAAIKARKRVDEWNDIGNPDLAIITIIPSWSS